MSVLEALFAALASVPLVLSAVYLLVIAPDNRRAERARAFLDRRAQRDALTPDDWRWFTENLRLAGRSWNHFTEEMR